VHAGLLDAQADLADAQAEDLVALLADAGVTDEEVTSCVTDGDFTTWVGAATERAADGVPYQTLGAVAASTVAVAETRYDGAADDADTFSAFLDEVATAVSSAEDLADG